MDCHAAAGCEVCAVQTDGADGLTGDDLRSHIATKDTTDSLRED